MPAVGTKARPLLFEESKMSNRKLTEAQVEQALEMVRGGVSCHQAAKRLGVGLGSVLHWCRKRGVKSKFRKNGATQPAGYRAEVGQTRERYLRKLMREALPEAVRNAAERNREATTGYYSL